MYTPISGEFNLIDALLVSIIAIILVFVVLIIIVVITSIFSTIIVNIDKKKNIHPRVENKLLDEDEDAVIATIVASMDFYKETKKDARLVSVKRAKEE